MHTTLIRAGIVLLSLPVLASVANAQAEAPSPASSAPAMPYNAGNVPSNAPFGAADISGAGSDAASVTAYVSGLTGQQVIDLIQRCLVVHPIRPMTADAAGAATTTYAATDIAFCGTLEMVLLGDLGSSAGDAAAAAPAAGEAAGNAAAAGAASPAAAAAGGMTVASYTADQARRGRDAYGDNCSVCHGDTLAGSAESPGLAGSGFRQIWLTGSPQRLFDFISTSMPQNAPGSLDPQTYADIIAYIIQYNHIPAGDAELPPDSSALAAITLPATAP